MQDLRNNCKKTQAFKVSMADLLQEQFGGVRIAAACPAPLRNLQQAFLHLRPLCRTRPLELKLARSINLS